jgi:hypothetical protein
MLINAALPLPQGEFAPKKLSHSALHIQTMPCRAGGMVQDSPIPDTPMLERRFGAKN